MTPRINYPAAAPGALKAMMGLSIAFRVPAGRYQPAGVA